MQSKEHRNHKLWLIAAFMVVSTILFVVGVTLERSSEGERHEAIAAPQESEGAHETQETGETHAEEASEAHSEATDTAHVEESNKAQEANQAHSEESGEVHSEEGEAHSETIFGFDPGFNLEFLACGHCRSRFAGTCSGAALVWASSSGHSDPCRHRDDPPRYL